MSDNNSGGTPLPENTVVPSGITMGGKEDTVQSGTHQHGGNINIAEKVLSVDDTLGEHAFIQNQGGNVPQDKEMAFTVVAVDTDLIGQVQLSIIPTVSENVASKLSTNAVGLSSAQNTGLFNQLALIATNMESSTSEPPHQTSVALAQLQQQSQQEPTPEMFTEEQNMKNQPEKSPGENITETDSKTADEKYNDDKNSKKTRVKCNVCNQDFSDLPSMRRHRLIHSDEKPYQCEFCEKAFRRKDNLREHRNIHTQENVYTCDRCGRTFPRKYTHKVHMAKFCTKERADCATKNGEENWVPSENDPENPDGELLGKAFPKSSGYTKCSDPCDICNKTFRDTSTLKRHMLTHSDERPFKCDECDKSFRRKDHLMEHVIVHNVLRPFTCLQCGKSFSRKNGLKTHMIRSSHKEGHDAQAAILAELASENREEQLSMVKKSDDDFQLLLTPNETLPENLTNSDEHISDTIINTNLGINDSNVRSLDVNSDHAQNPPGTNRERSVVPDEVMVTDVISENEMRDSSHLPQIPENPDTMDSEKSDYSMVQDSFNESGISEKSDMECPNCQHLFPGKEELSSHFQVHLRDNQSACELCFTTFAAPELAKEHQTTCTFNKSRTDTVLEAPAIKLGDVAQSEDILNLGISADLSSEMDETGEKPEESDVTKKIVVSDGKGMRTCTVCDKSFRDSTALKRHSLVHSGERPHACTRCGKRFRRRDHLKSHVTAYHCVTTTFQCKGCHVVFNTRYCLATHTKTCKKSTARQQSATGETSKVSGTLESRTCPICNKVFKDPSSQRRHLRVHSDERPFQCDLCTKSFRRKDNLKEHQLCHSDQKPFACEDCGKTLSRRSSLTNHRTICAMRRVDIRTVVTENAPITEEVLLQGSQETVVNEHATGLKDQEVVDEQPITQQQHSTIDTDHLQDTQPLPNTQMLPTTLEAETHPTQEITPGPNHPNPDTETLQLGNSGGMTSHDINDPDTMEEEVVGEDDDKGFTCNLCGKVFRAKWTLKYHQRVHTGEKPYMCLTCERHFRQPSHLKIHQRTHSGERPYMCEACGRAFIDSSTMRRHSRVHKVGTADPSTMNEPESNAGTMEENNHHEPRMMVTPVNQAITPQPINIVPPTNQSENTNLVGQLERNEENQGDGIAIAINKIPDMGEGNWQTQQSVGQTTYYIVQANKESNEKQDSYEHMSF